jgi:hypothetical protein
MAPPTTASVLCELLVVGQELGSKRDTTRREAADEDEDEEGEDEEGPSWMDELYEEVPFHFRKCVPSHSIFSYLTCRIDGL